MNEIVKYKHELNALSMRTWTPNEIDMFFTILAVIKNQGTNIITLPFSQYQLISDYKRSSPRFHEDLKTVHHKLASLQLVYDEPNVRYSIINLFNKFDIDFIHEEVTIQINESALPYLNNVVKNYVMFSLKELTDLNSSYSKTMFRLLKQWRTVGRREFSKEELYAHLCIPKSYQKSENDLNKRVFKPIKEELTPLFPGLSISKIKGKGRGNPVIGYKFTWKPEHTQYIENDHTGYKPTDEKTKIKNITYNSDLTEQEKWRAMDRVQGLKLGTTEAMQSELKAKQELIDSLDEQSRSTYDMFMRIGQPEFAENVLEQFKNKLKLADFKLESEARNYINSIAN